MTAPWRSLPIALGLTLLALQDAAAQGTLIEGGAVVDDQRPRIGLALGGGGARGGAHAGVLKVLDELRIPIDCVAGTSMGALVGATFAAGASADQIEREMRRIDWIAALGFEGQRQFIPIQRRLAGITYSNDIQFSAWGGRLHGDAGFLATQHVEELLRLLVGDAREIDDFDHLPIPFRAVATDLTHGRMVVLDGGDLTRAMRASMAVPGVFAPIVMDDRVLADGGIMRNLPVDVVRELCADVVIAVALEAPWPTAQELQSLFAVAGRAIDTVISANEAEQLATLTDQDVAIVVDMGEIRAADFARVEETIPLGAQAARDQAAKLRRYALSEEDYRAWRARVQRPEAAPLRIADLRFAPLRHAASEYLASRLHIKAGDEVTLVELEEDMSRVFASGDFLRVDYRLLPATDAGRPVEIHAIERPGGTDFLRFDLGIAGSSGGDVLFALRADHRREWINRLGGQWRNALQLGQLSELETVFYQPLDVAQHYYLEPGLSLRRSLEDVFDDGDRLARYDLLMAEARLDVGWNLSDFARLRGGVRWGVAEFEPDIGAVPLFEEGSTRDASIVAGAIYDTRDAAALPTRGSFAQLEFTSSGKWLGGEESYEQLEGVLGHTARWGGNVLHLTGGVGRTLSGELPRYRDFRIGGVRSFPALKRGELRGEGYWAGSATWLLRVRDVRALFGQVYYAGLGVHAVRMTDRVDQVSDGTILGASLTLGARTPLGPLLLSLGGADNGSIQLHLALGRPIAEGSLLDRLH